MELGKNKKDRRPSSAHAPDTLLLLLLLPSHTHLHPPPLTRSVRQQQQQQGKGKEGVSDRGKLKTGEWHRMAARAFVDRTGEEGQRTPHHTRSPPSIVARDKDSLLVAAFFPQRPFRSRRHHRWKSDTCSHPPREIVVRVVVSGPVAVRIDCPCCACRALSASFFSAAAVLHLTLPPTAPASPTLRLAFEITRTASLSLECPVLIFFFATFSQTHPTHLRIHTPHSPRAPPQILLSARSTGTHNKP